MWRHEGLEILSVCLLLLALSKLRATQTTMRLAAAVGLMPAIAVVYALLTTPFWKPAFLVPGAACFAFAVYGFVLCQGERAFVGIPSPRFGWLDRPSSERRSQTR